MREDLPTRRARLPELIEDLGRHGSVELPSEERSGIVNTQRGTQMPRLPDEALAILEDAIAEVEREFGYPATTM
jgi:hypothetical protein